MMNASSVPVVEVCGHMGGVSSESDSSDESSPEGTIEFEFEEPNTASSSSIEDTSFKERLTALCELGGPRAVELDGIMVASLPTPPAPNEESTRCDPGAKTLAGMVDRARLEHQPVDTAFGIAYKPCGGSSRGYNLPSGPAFVDEDEFEQEMSPEFRVVAGSSVGSAEIPTTSDMAQSRNSNTAVDTDDFLDGERTAGDAKMAQELSECTLGPTNSMPSSALSSSEQGVPDGNGVKLPENVGVAPPSPSGLKLDNQEALKQLTEEYEKAESAPQRIESARLLDHSSENIGEGHSESSTAVNAGISVHVGGDVRQYPVMEEEEGEGGEEDEDEGEEPDDEHVEVVNDPEKIGNPNVQREGEEGQQTGNEDEDEDSRRARVAKEWEAIDQLRTAESSVPMEKGVGGTLQPISIDEDNRVIGTEEVLRYFRSQAPESRFGLFRRAPSLKFPSGEQLRDEVFLFAKIKYTPDEVMHRRLIQTIYRRMTKEKRACPDVGPHWDTIGFQGTDPCTDLNRSMGMFALFQVLYLLETQLEFAMVLYRLSLADVTGWPFLCVSIGFTKEAVGVLRRGSCYSECNRRGCVLDVVNELHQAQFHAFLELCRKEPATHHALHLAKVRTHMDTESRVLVKAYHAYLSDDKVRSAVGVVEKKGGGAAGHELLDFSGGVKTGEDRRIQEGGALIRKKQYLSDERPPGRERTNR